MQLTESLFGQSAVQRDLRAAVRSLIGVRHFVLGNVVVDRVNSGKGDGAVFRISGTAHHGADATPWSLVAKVYRMEAKVDNPRAVNNWEREELLYRSDLPRFFPSAVSIPRPVHVSRRVAGYMTLWLEEIDDYYGRNWGLREYMQAAMQLGCLNGKFTRLPQSWTRNWLVREAVGQWSQDAVSKVRLLTSSSSSLPLALNLSQDILPRLAKIADRREQYSELLQILPQSFCHLDAYKRNLFLRKSHHQGDELVLIDWSHCGYGALGEELTPLISLSPFFFEDCLHQNLFEADRVIFGAYMTGLAQYLEVEHKTIRKGFCAAMALRLLCRAAFMVDFVLDPLQRSRWSIILGHSFGEILDRFGLVFTYMLTTAEELDEYF